MKLIVFAGLLLATLVARATCITNVEFFKQIQDKGDVEYLATFPDDVDDDTIVLAGDPEDELDEEYLTKALKFEPPVSDDDEVPDEDETPHHFHIHFHFHRRRRRSLEQTQKAATSSTRCRSKSIIVNLDQPKKITQTFCLRLTRLSSTVYHARLVQDENVIMDRQVMILGKSKDICVPFRSASNMNACMHFRLKGSSVCTNVATDFWSGFKLGVDFGCMEPGARTEG